MEVFLHKGADEGTAGQQQNISLKIYRHIS